MAQGACSSHWYLKPLASGKLYHIKCLSCKRTLLRHTDSFTEGSNCLCNNNAEVIWPFCGDFRIVKIIAGDFNLIEVEVEDI